MASFDANTLSEIKARIDLVDLISEYGIDLHRAGSSAKACCPFHKEKTPSFHVSSDKGFYKCFGCGEHGDIFTFVQKFEGISFSEAVKKLAERAGIHIEERYDPQAKLKNRLYQINQEVAAFYRRCLLQTKEAQAARDYLSARALDGSISEQFCIGYAPNRRDTLLEWAKRRSFSPDELVAAGLLAPPRTPTDTYYDRFHGRITFPICDIQGRIVAFSCRLIHPAKNTGKYINSPETDIFKKSQTLYALHIARTYIAKAVPRRALVCEGQIDVIRCHACGFNIAVASQGTAFTADHVTLLKRYADTADLVFDGDAAGTKAAIRTLGLFLSAGMPVRIVTLPSGEDPDSLLKTQGVEAFRHVLASAEDPAPYLVRRLREREAAPDAMDATMRIAKTAVTTILDCPEPVLCARFLQDIAHALQLPVETLREDLKTLQNDAAEAARRRDAFLARQPHLPITQRDSHKPTHNPVPPPAYEPNATEQDIFSDDNWMAADDIDVLSPDNAPLEVTQTGTPSPTITLSELEASHNLCAALCELLVHHFTDHDVMDCLIRHLPPVFVRHPFAAKLYDLAVTAALQKSDQLALSAEDQAFTLQLARQLTLPDRMTGDEESTPLRVAQDLVLRFWLDEYALAIKRLPANDPEALQLTLSRKRLKSLEWNKAEPFMDALNPSFLQSIPLHSKQLPRPLTPTIAPQSKHLTSSVDDPSQTHGSHAGDKPTKPIEPHWKTDAAGCATDDPYASFN
mgnify:CR=1 FL=1